MENALCCMQTGKAAGLSRITPKLLKFMGQVGVKRLLGAANELLEGLKMPESWRKSELVSLKRGKATYYYA